VFILNLTRSLRSVLAMLIGGIVAAVLFQVGAIVALLGVYGIPLGAESPNPGVLYFVINLGFAALGAGLGGWLAARLVGGRPLVPAAALALGLAVLALWGFSRPSSQWPAWYPGALALVGGGAALVGGVVRRGQTGE
jgi:hypothetical protein